ncbi:MAG: glycoside hydrolase family 66 protein [Planctomycetota bacterium]
MPRDGLSELQVRFTGLERGRAYECEARYSMGARPIRTERVGLRSGGPRSYVEFEWSWPIGMPPGGVLVELDLIENGRVVDSDFEVLNFSPWQGDDLRYGFFATWDELGEDYAAKADMLLDAHVNAVEYYDYFPAHGRYVPSRDPGGVQTSEPFGITLLNDDIWRKQDALRRSGIWSIAYVAAYAATESVFGAHPFPMTDENGTPLVFNGAIKPETVADEAGEDKWFWLMAIGEGSPWRDRMVEQFGHVVSERGGRFDGLAIDSYGHASDAVYHDSGGASDGEPLVDVLAGFVGAVRQRLRSANSTAAITFNAVDEFALDQMRSVTNFSFVENWPWHRGTYGGVADLAYRRGPMFGHRIVLKMYPADAGYKVPDGDGQFPPDHLRLMMGAAIAGGGTLMVAGEPDESAGVMHALNTLYYPDHRPMTTEAYEVLRSYNRFDAMLYGLNHGSARAASFADVAVVHDGAFVDPADADLVTHTFWASNLNALTVTLLNAGPDERWDEPPADRVVREGFSLRVRASRLRPRDGGVRGYFVSPDDPEWSVPRPIEVRVEDDGVGSAWVVADVPSLDVLGAVILHRGELVLPGR